MTTLATEARKARLRYQDRGAFAGSSEAAQQACWEEAVRPLVEEIARLRAALALADDAIDAIDACEDAIDAIDACEDAKERATFSSWEVAGTRVRAYRDSQVRK